MRVSPLAPFSVFSSANQSIQRQGRVDENIMRTSQFRELVKLARQGLSLNSSAVKAVFYELNLDEGSQLSLWKNALQKTIDRLSRFQLKNQLVEYARQGLSLNSDQVQAVLYKLDSDKNSHTRIWEEALNKEEDASLLTEMLTQYLPMNHSRVIDVKFQPLHNVGNTGSTEEPPTLKTFDTVTLPLEDDSMTVLG